MSDQPESQPKNPVMAQLANIDKLLANWSGTSLGADGQKHIDAGIQGLHPGEQGETPVAQNDAPPAPGNQPQAPGKIPAKPAALPSELNFAAAPNPYEQA